MIINKLRAILFIFPLMCFFSLHAQDDGSLLFTAWLTGSEEVPPVATDAAGLAGFRLSANRDSLTVLAMATGLNSPISGASIQESQRGTTGGVLKSLELMQIGNKFYGVITGTDLTTAMIAKMLRGETYINFSTQNNPDGEIRGQIYLEKDYSLQAVLGGEKVVPAVVTNAYGLASFRLTHDKTRLQINAVFNNLSNTITDAKLFLGKAGENGSIAMDLMPYISGNKIDTSLDVRNFPLLSADALTEDKVYMQIATKNNSNGEIRGTLNRKYGIDFYAVLDGTQETTPNQSIGYGLGLFRFNAALDTLYYDIVINDLSGAVTDAFFYLGKSGENGTAIIDIKDSLSGNRFAGSAYGIQITKAILKAFLEGNIYVNIATQNFKNGEIRGQLTSTLRGGYLFELCPQQETEAVSAKSAGVGVVSVDERATNMRYMIVADSLSSNITSAYFYEAPQEQNGHALFEANAIKNGFKGYWYDTSTTNFTEAIAKEIAQGNVYINIFTDNFSSGELRGQVVNKALCSQTVGMWENRIAISNINIFPMPFSNILTITAESLAPENYSFKILDAQGKTISNTNAYMPAGKNAFRKDLSNIPDGLYFLQIWNSHGITYSSKIIKQ